VEMLSRNALLDTGMDLSWGEGVRKRFKKKGKRSFAIEGLHEGGGNGNWGDGGGKAGIILRSGGGRGKVL